jgi:hypothetical protein
MPKKQERLNMYPGFQVAKIVIQQKQKLEEGQVERGGREGAAVGNERKLEGGERETRAAVE